jgi:hypothetical protein
MRTSGIAANTAILRLLDAPDVLDTLVPDPEDDLVKVLENE